MNRSNLGYFEHVINKDMFGDYIYWKICENIYYEMDSTDYNETIIIFTDKNIKIFRDNLINYLKLFMITSGDNIKQTKLLLEGAEYQFEADGIAKHFKILIFDIYDLMRSSDKYRGYRSMLTVLDIKTETYREMNIELLTHRLLPMNMYSTIKYKPYYGMMLLYEGKLE